MSILTRPILEINLDTLFDIKTGKIKVKETTKFPGMSKDVAFVLDKRITSDEVIASIKKEGGKLLKSVTVFDYYEGEKIEEIAETMGLSRATGFRRLNAALEELTGLYETLQTKGAA